jgi:hypothetical protein
MMEKLKVSEIYNILSPELKRKLEIFLANTNLDDVKIDELIKIIEYTFVEGRVKGIGMK